MNKIFEELKIDIGLAPVSLNGNSTGKYYDLADYRKAIAVLQVGAMAASFTAKLELFQAINSAGGSGALLAGATCTITANASITSGTLTLGTVLNTHTVVITVGGTALTFTGHTDTTTVASRQFSIAGTDSQDADELCICLNDSTYGIAPLGLTASNNAGVVTIISTIPGAVVFTIAQGVGATIVCATLSAESYVEIDALSLTKTFNHIACKVTTTSAQVVSAILLRGGQRGAITQKVGASASV